MDITGGCAPPPERRVLAPTKNMGVAAAAPSRASSTCSDGYHIEQTVTSPRRRPGQPEGGHLE